MRKILFVIFLSQILAGCGVYMAATQPDAKNVSLFMKETDRNQLHAEFGAPQSSEVDSDGKKHEIFVFTQGYSSGSKIGRAVFHGAADIFTLGLWEIVATPLESYFDGDKKAFEVIYDEDNKVMTIIPINVTD